MDNNRLDVRSWLLRVLAWDGLLPVGVVLTPALLALALPNNHGAIELSSILLPVTAFLARYNAGKRHIARNNCSDVVRYLQFFVFVIGICGLALIEAWLILTHVMPNGAALLIKATAMCWRACSRSI